MKRLLIILLASVLFNTFSFSQKKEEEATVDTTSKTKIERLLRETSVIKKVQFIEIEKVKVVQFQIIVITNLKTGEKAKGLYLSNKSGVNIWTGAVKGERHAYLDENEIDELISFLESCDNKWKNEMPQYQTQYEFESLDNLKIMFWTKKESKSWMYSITFSNYIFDNREELKKSQSDELLDALKQVKTRLVNH